MPRLLLSTFHIAHLFSLLGLSGTGSECEATAKRGLVHCFKRLDMASQVDKPAPISKAVKRQPKDEVAAALLIGAPDGCKGLALYATCVPRQFAVCRLKPHFLFKR